MAVAPLVAVACVFGGGEDSAGAVELAPRTETISKSSNASVLIIPRADDLAIKISTVRPFPASIVLEPGEVVVLDAEAFGPAGEPLSEVDFVWTVADPRSGVIRAERQFQAGSTPGVYNGAVTLTGIQNTPQGIQFAAEAVTVVVVGQAVTPELASVLILPAKPVVLKGQIYRMRAVGFDRNGRLIPGVSLFWQVNDQSLGRVNDLGYLTVEGVSGSYPGAVTVTGIWEGARVQAVTDVLVIQGREADDFLLVQVLPQRFFLDPRDRMRLRAVALNGLGELVAGTQMRWEIVDPAAGTIDGNGLFVAGDRPGIYTEAVRVEAIVRGESGFVRAADFASVVIREPRAPRVLERVRVAPESVLVTPGGRVLLLVKALDDVGAAADDAKVSWEVVDEAVGQIDQYGSFEATFTPGSYPGALLVTVRQELEDEAITKTRSIDVTVTGAIARVEVRPSLATIVPGRTVHFTATAWDANDVKLLGLVVLWRVTDRAVGTIDAFGNFTAGDVAGLYQDAIRAEVKQNLPVSP
ncbi:MAG: hypothetical protein IH956_02830 [Chloroflexi bacterium]|nr:hypothetical protein [Chloroflexota bacterium]